MGTWGTGIFQNDIADDVKTRYIELLHDGYSGKEANDALIEENRDILSLDCLLDAEEFWLSLAAIEWSYGRLIDETKTQAMEFLKNQTIYFENPKDQKDRLSVKQQLLQQLEKTMPAEKKVKVYKGFICPYKIGDIFALPLNSEKSRLYGKTGNYISFQKVGVYEDYPKLITPVFYVAKKVFESKPTVEDYLQAPLLPQFWAPENYGKFWDGTSFKLDDVLYGVAVRVTSKRSYPKDLMYIGHSFPAKKGFLEREDDSHHTEWSRFESFFWDMYNLWKDIDITKAFE